MTQSTFVSSIQKIVAAKGVKTSGSRESGLNAIGRRIERKEISEDEALAALRDVFYGDRDLGRHDFEAMQKVIKSAKL